VAEPLEEYADPELLREQRLYDRVLALTGSLERTRIELEQTASQIRVLHLSLERARKSPAWRVGRVLTKPLRWIGGRRVDPEDPLDSAMSKLAALERSEQP
jgi:hypothetical protein